MKLFFSDLDETLLINWGVPEVNQAAVRKAMEKGHKFIPCSGRPPFFVTDVLKELGTYQKENEYYICFNGGMILETKNDKVLFFQGLSYEEAAELIGLAESLNICIMIVCTSRFYMFNPDPAELERKHRQQADVRVFDHYDPSVLKGETIGKAMLVKTGGMKYLREIYKTFPEELKNKYEFSFSSSQFMEINTKGVSKGNALRHLAEYLHVDMKDTIAIGDNMNDMSMLTSAGVSACVAGAIPEVKEICDYVCEKDCLDGAVAEVLEKFGE